MLKLLIDKSGGSHFQLFIFHFSDYNAFKGGLKSALHRTLFNHKGHKEGHKGAQRLNLHVRPDLSEGRCGSLP
ncbi:MAG: hypothetical protein DRI57_21670 [Deltaproteobacteria bacterium]|nr:MAG: hypothetical protein DRI57_21670 [Deltaproteobacteria bacterium]